jgi:hypothetical protein
MTAADQIGVEITEAVVVAEEEDTAEGTEKIEVSIVVDAVDIVEDTQMIEETEVIQVTEADSQEIEEAIGVDSEGAVVVGSVAVIEVDVMEELDIVVDSPVMVLQVVPQQISPQEPQQVLLAVAASNNITIPVEDMVVERIMPPLEEVHRQVLSPQQILVEIVGMKRVHIVEGTTTREVVAAVEITIDIGIMMEIVEVVIVESMMIEIRDVSVVRNEGDIDMKSILHPRFQVSSQVKCASILFQVSSQVS